VKKSASETGKKCDAYATTNTHNSVYPTLRQGQLTYSTCRLLSSSPSFTM